MGALYDRLARLAAPEQLLRGEPMAAHTTFRVGGPADWMFFPADEGQVAAALDAAREAGVPALVMGNGSNLIVRDGGFRGLAIVLGESG